LLLSNSRQMLTPVVLGDLLYAVQSNYGIAPRLLHPPCAPASREGDYVGTARFGRQRDVWRGELLRLPHDIPSGSWRRGLVSRFQHTPMVQIRPVTPWNFVFFRLKQVDAHESRSARPTRIAPLAVFLYNTTADDCLILILCVHSSAFRSPDNDVTRLRQGWFSELSDG